MYKGDLRLPQDVSCRCACCAGRFRRGIEDTFYRAATILALQYSWLAVWYTVYIVVFVSLLR